MLPKAEGQFDSLMSCVLRVWGVDLNIDSLLTTSTMKPCKVYRAGEPRFPAGSRICTYSGANFRISDADFSSLNEQVSDTLIFLEENKELLLSLRDFPGVDGVTIDFAAEIDPERYSNSFKFPNELLVSAGSLGISLELSIYSFVEDPDHPSSQAASVHADLPPSVDTPSG